MQAPTAVARRILIVDDDEDTATLLAMTVRAAGFAAAILQTGADVVTIARRDPPALVLLDVGLPDVDGFDVCRALRADPLTAQVAVIMVSARAAERDRVTGLELGADDYIIKPFSRGDLLARIQAVLRRVEGPVQVLQFGPVRMELAEHRVFSRDREVHLTVKEFQLLRYLMERCERPVSRARLLADVWQHHEPLATRTLDVHVSRLREKLPELNDLLVTITAFGYKLTASPPD